MELLSRISWSTQEIVSCVPEDPRDLLLNEKQKEIPMFSFATNSLLCATANIESTAVSMDVQ